MSQAFSSLYATTYDALYRDKDYEGECELLRYLFAEHGNGAIKSVLDLGCGTANHSVRLAALGYDVVGVERSPAMLEIARAKAATHANVELHESDIRSFDLGRPVDAVVLLFAVLGYLIEDEDVMATLATARRHLRPGGLLVFDVWYGPAVLEQRPSPRFSRIPLERGELLRAATPQLDQLKQLCRVHYELWHVEEDRIRETAEEEHAIRFFFGNELRMLLSRSGFSLVRLSGFPDLEHEPDETTWNVVAVARVD